MPDIIKMKYFSLFSGIGGFELGIQRAMPEAECVGYSEVDKHATEIYEGHFPEHRNYGDATRIVPSELPDFDLLVAGFPCQAFSIAGKRRGFQDSRGTLFFEIARICADKRPGYILLENVKGILGHSNGETFQRILGVLSNIGYLLQWEVLNSKHFGVPQNRERVFIVGHLRDRPRPEVFPIGEGCQTSDTEKSTVYCLDANYGKGAARGSRSMILHENKSGNVAIHTDNTCALRSGGSHNYQTVSFVYAKHQQDRVYKDIMCCLPKGTHNNAGQFTKTLVDGAIRRLTPLEWERLQSFPDGWTEGLSDTARYRCLGNAVTVNVIEAIMTKWLQEKEFEYGY